VGQLHSQLSDAGIYSYAAICALVLHELFDNEWDEKFKYQCVKLILKHLHLPKQVLFHFMYLNSMSYLVICVMEEVWMTYTQFLLMIIKVTWLLCDTAPLSEVM